MLETSEGEFSLATFSNRLREFCTSLVIWVL